MIQDRITKLDVQRVTIGARVSRVTAHLNRYFRSLRREAQVHEAVPDQRSRQSRDIITEEL